MTHDATVDCDLEEMPGDFVVFFVGRGREWRLLGFSRKVLCGAIPVRCQYELFHKNFTSFHCTGRYELNKLTSLPMCGFIAQLVEHRTGIAEVTGSNPVEALIFFFQASSFQLLKLENLLR